MSRLLRPFLLPTALVVMLSAQECESPPAFRASETLTVRPDAGVEVNLVHEADSVGWLLDWDPPPAREMGWDSVHLGQAGNEGFVLRAWRSLPPGSALPPSYATPGDPLANWYVRFPSSLTTEERGDTIFFRFRRTYPALEWFPDELFRSLREELRNVEALKEAAEREMKEDWKDLERRWAELEDLGDSLTVPDSLLVEEGRKQLREQLRETLWSGDPPWIELHRRSMEYSARIHYLSRVAMVVPAVASVPGGDDPSCARAVGEVLMAPLSEIEVTREEAFGGVLDELGLLGRYSGGTEGESRGVGRGEAGLEDREGGIGPQEKGRTEEEDHETLIRELRDRTVFRVREVLRADCGLSGPVRHDFETRCAWFTRRYRVEDGRLSSQSFSVELSMPGDLVETNADTVLDGRARWKFRLADLTEADRVLSASSRLVREGGW